MLGLLAFDRNPRGLVAAQLVEVVIDGFLAHRSELPLQRKTAQPVHRDLRACLHQELEGERGAIFDLYVPNLRLSKRLQRFLVHCQLPALADQLLDGGLLDGVAEPPPDHLQRNLAFPESGHPRTLGVHDGGLFFRRLHTAHGGLDTQRGRARLVLGSRDLYFGGHARLLS